MIPDTQRRTRPCTIEVSILCAASRLDARLTILDAGATLPRSVRGLRCGLVTRNVIGHV